MKKVQKDKGAVIGVRIDPKLKARLLAQARREDRTLSWVVIRLLEEGVKKREALKAA